MNRIVKTNNANMIIGIDFDNTIIDYNNLFYRAGFSLGILPDNESYCKKTIREYLIGKGREQDWIKIQGLVYGKYIRSAKVMEGFSSFSDLCYKKGWVIYIVSHKTRDSIVGEKFNLHTSAFHWLEYNRIYGKGIRGSVKGVFFESTRSDKICRINQLNCNIIIDDLVEVLQHPDLSKDIIKILYDPDSDIPQNPDFFTVSRWDLIYRIITRLYGKFG